MAPKNPAPTTDEVEEIEEVEETDVITPKALAEELEVSPKTLRGWLRRQFPRGDAHGKSWILSEDQAEAARAHFSGEDDEDDSDETEVEDEG